MFSNFFVLFQVSKYFGKCFGPSTPAPKSSFWLRCPSFLLLKFFSQLKLIQSVVRVRILGTCIKSSILRVLLSGYWVSESLFPSPRDLFPGSWVSGSHVPEYHSRVLGVRLPESLVSGSQGPRSQGPGSQASTVLSLRILGSQVSGLRVPRPGTQVLILDYAVCECPWWRLWLFWLHCWGTD